ncbi:MAG: DUF3261 domain-containing protein [Candidatus Scalindua sp.]|nr:DUF3261 domain-containing protein [Candidatus Scalindua sp.]MCR4344665.1 DUF3261 domain-containing protein [Candidatus Scalindua sp.]
MKIHLRIIWPFLLVFFSACAKSPFEKVDFKSVAHLEPNRVRENFEKLLPSSFEVIESAVYIYKGLQIAVISYTRVNEKEDTVEIIGFNPLGLKLVQVQTSGAQVKYSFNIPQIKKRLDEETLAEAIAEDIRRIYFGRVPPANAYAHKEKGKIVVEQKKGEDKIEWVFGGPDNRLYQKHYFRGKREAWSVRYFEYEVNGGYLYPCKIFLENYDHKYKLVLRLKEILE